MTSFVTNAGSAHILAVLFGRTEAPLATYYLGLCTALPEIGDDGSTILEPDATTGYQRAIVPNDNADWDPSGYYEAFNANDIVFPTVPEAGGWGVLNAYAVLDVADLGSGRLLLCGTLNPPISPAPLAQVVIHPQQLMITVSSLAPSFQPT